MTTISFWSMFKDLAMATVKVSNHPYAINEPVQSCLRTFMRFVLMVKYMKYKGLEAYLLALAIFHVTNLC